MKWPRRKRPVTLAKDESTLDLQNSKTQLREIRSRWPEVNALVNRLGTLNRENHYTDMVIDAMRGGSQE